MGWGDGGISSAGEGCGAWWGKEASETKKQTDGNRSMAASRLLPMAAWRQLGNNLAAWQPLWALPDPWRSPPCGTWRGPYQTRGSYPPTPPYPPHRVHPREVREANLQGWDLRGPGLGLGESEGGVLTKGISREL
jgi:hypothetical protein